MSFFKHITPCIIRTYPPPEKLKKVLTGALTILILQKLYYFLYGSQRPELEKIEIVLRDINRSFGNMENNLKGDTDGSRKKG